MQFVDRKNVPTPLVLIGAASKGELEKAAAIAFYRTRVNKGKTFPGFKIYKHESVKIALLELFHYKCAYCEMNYGGAPLDVEHFRPKSAVVDIFRGKEVLNKPGYYWLAADWYNLLPSCIDCNRPRVHSHTRGLTSVLGKANKFPLAAGTSRERKYSNDPEKTEQRLLLDPCRDRPEKHFRYDAKNGIIKPRQIKGVLSEMAIASIECFGLQRNLLVERRHAHASKLRFHIDAANRFAGELKKNQRSSLAQRALAFELNAIKSFLATTEPFSAMTREIIRVELKTD